MANYANDLAFLGALQGLGVPKKTALGALGSIAWESGPTLNNKARNAGDGSDGSDSIGWGQWNGPRARNLQGIAARLGTDWHDPAAQTAHIKSELTGPYKHVLDALKSRDDTRFGADVWTRQYEVPAIKNVDQRYGRALELAKSIDPNGDYTSSIPVPSPSSGGGAQVAAAGGQPSSAQAPGLLGSIAGMDQQQAKSAKDQVLALLASRQSEPQPLQLQPMQGASQQNGGLLAYLQQLQGAA